MKHKSFLRYLIELVIVITGVTIAFWLNTRAEEMKEQKILSNYYLELQSDLQMDRKALERCVNDNQNKRSLMIKAMAMYLNGEPQRDSVFYYSRFVGNYYFFDPRDITYRSMISSGDLKLISDMELKRRLISLYDTYQLIEELEDNYLEALDENYFPKYVELVDYVEGEVIAPIEEDMMIKNYFAYSANDLGSHISLYKLALRKNQLLDSLIATNF